MPVNPQKLILLLRSLRKSYNSMSWGRPSYAQKQEWNGCGVQQMKIYLSYLYLRAKSLFFVLKQNSQILKRDLQLSTIMRVQSIISQFFGQFGAVQRPDPAKVIFSFIVTFCLTKNENRTKKSLTQLSHYCFE